MFRICLSSFAHQCLHLSQLISTIKKKFIIHLWLCWVFAAAWAFLQVRGAGNTPVAVRRLLNVTASLVAEHRL